jgi:predicted nucleic acid-binding protein
VKFWDASAIVPLVLDEPSSGEAHRELSERRGLIVWWGTVVECGSAVARAEREGRLEPGSSVDAFAALRLLRSGWVEMDATSGLREIAERLVRTHPIRAADALQLAAATVASEGRPHGLPFVTLDERLAMAAVREGFPVVRFAQS